MRRFDRYRKDKLQDDRFRALYHEECHVCRYTVQIFETLIRQNTSIQELAADMGVDPKKIQLLEDADFCDPRLTIRICDHLGLAPPPACPRLEPRNHLTP